MTHIKGDFDSSVNQRIKDKFIQREVFANVNTMVEYIIGKGYEDPEAPFSMDDIINLSINHDEEIEELEEEKEELENKFEEAEEAEEHQEIERIQGLKYHNYLQLYVQILMHKGVPNCHADRFETV